jgi:hypothetical protein
MPELDDMLAADRASRDTAAAYKALGADHNLGWKLAPIAPEMEQFVTDFVARVSPTAGEPAYWVHRLSMPTVHLVPERFSVFSNQHRNVKARSRHLSRMMRAESTGETRLLTISTDRSLNGTHYFSFVRANNTWVPVLDVEATHEWPHSLSYFSDYAKAAMVEYLR